MRIERADGVDLVAEKVDANREVGPGWKEVENAASARNLAGLLNERRGFVSVVGDPSQELVLGQPVAHSEHPDRGSKHIRRHDDLHQPVRRGNQDRARFCRRRSGQRIQECGALGRRLEVERELLIWQRFRRRPERDRPGREGTRRSPTARVSARSPREAATRTGPDCRLMAAAASAALADTGRSGTTID